MPHPRSVSILAWAGFVSLAVAMGIGRFAFTPMLPMMQDDLGLGLAQGGWLASANYLGYLAGALTAAYLPWRGSTLLIIGLLLVAFTTALMSWTTTWSSWIAWRSIAGIASAWVLVATASLAIGRLAQAGASQKAGLVFAGVGAGIALSGVLCLYADLAGYSANQTWLMLAVMAAFGIMATRPLWQAAPALDQASPAVDAAGAESGPQWRLVLCYGFFGFGYILPATFLPAQARELLNDAAYFGLAWPLFGISAAISTLACSVMLRRHDRRTLWMAAQMTMALGVVIPALVPGLGAIIVAAVCVGGTFMVITMLGMQQAQISGGPRARALMASLTAAFAAGQLAGPVFFSLIHEHLGATLDASLYVAAIALMAGCLLLMKPFAAHGAGQPAR